MVEKIRNKMKETKGFTLVELIVVLVILAILAAMLVPALTGYIDRANEEKIVAETRQVVMAAQTVASEKYAEGKTDADIKTTIETTTNNDVLALAELTGKGAISSVTVTSGSVETLTWTHTGQKACTYTKNPAAGSETYSVANS